MKAQLFATGTDFARFCKTKRQAKRRALRSQVTARLKTLAALAPGRRSQTAAPSSLKAESSARSRRLWLVNGFFAEASTRAIRELAAREDVGFVYRQRVMQQQRVRQRPISEAARTAMASALQRKRGSVSVAQSSPSSTSLGISNGFACTSGVEAVDRKGRPCCRARHGRLHDGFAARRLAHQDHGEAQRQGRRQERSSSTTSLAGTSLRTTRALSVMLGGMAACAQVSSRAARPKVELLALRPTPSSSCSAAWAYSAPTSTRSSKARTSCR